MVDETAIREFLTRQRVSDGFDAFSEAKVLVMKQPDRSVVIAEDERVVAMGVAGSHHQPNGTTRWAVETAVERSMRFPEFEDRVLASALSLVPERTAVGVWSRRPSLDAALGRAGFSVVRSLTEMSVPLPLEEHPAIGIRPFEPGDIGLLVRINAAAFSDHKEAAGLDEFEVARLMSEPWFDPGGVLFHEVGGTVAAFCWTKVHETGEGEIYRIGVDPGFEGQGIGRRIVLAGLAHLWEARSCAVGFLWVDDENMRATRLYRSIGMQARSFNREFERTSPG